MISLKELVIEIINKSKGCTINQIVEILHIKSDYNSYLLRNTDISEFISKTTEEQIAELSEVIYDLSKYGKITCLKYKVPDERYNLFLVPKETKIEYLNNKAITNNENNVSIGYAILYLFFVITWIFGIALSVGWIKILLAIIFPPYAWVVWAEWVIEIINKII